MKIIYFPFKRNNLKLYFLTFLHCLFFSVFCVFSQTILAQTISSFVPEIGFPLVRNFSPEQYGSSSSQNWAIAQSPNGFIYVGNNGGVLEFDGKDWRRYETTNKSTVKSLAITKKGEIVVGAKGEIGILKPDSTGTLHYVSLMHKIPEDKQNFNDVWQIFVKEKKSNYEVYFRTAEQILIYENGAFVKIIEPKDRFYTAFFVDNIFYVKDNQDDEGLLKLSQKYKLERIAEQIVGIGNIYGVFKGKENDVLRVFTRPEGVFEIKNKKSTAIKFASSSTLNQAKGYTSILLPTNEIAVATLRDGVFITDFEGNIKLHLNKENILQSNTIYDLFLDKQHNLWLATDNGISCVYLNVPYSTIGENQNAAGKGLTVDYSKNYNKIYLGTTLGIYQNNYKNRTNPTNGKYDLFSIVERTEGYALASTSYKNKIYHGHSLGIFRNK